MPQMSVAPPKPQPQPQPQPQQEQEEPEQQPEPAAALDAQEVIRRVKSAHFVRQPDGTFAQRIVHHTPTEGQKVSTTVPAESWLRCSGSLR